MGLSHRHEMHGRRRGRNLGLGLVLLGFVALLFGLTVVKVTVLDPQIAAREAEAAGAASLPAQTARQPAGEVTR